ncbi:MAG: dihydroorotase, partial [Spirochaetaceae bacterium]
MLETMKKPAELILRQPDDMHVHFRQGEMMEAVVTATSNVFARAVVMPNTIPPITTVERVENYRSRIIDAADEGFEPLMTFKILPGMDPDLIAGLKAANVVAGKLYPEGATTNSEDGVSDVRQIYPVLELMQQHDIVLSIHGEDPAVFSLDREEAFLPVIKQLRKDFPALRIVLEHLTTAAAVEAVRDIPNIAGTLTVHHLELTLDDLLGGELHPHFFCKPIVKRPADRDALRRAAMSGEACYFFGSDSA